MLPIFVKSKHLIVLECVFMYFQKGQARWARIKNKLNF